MCVCYSLTHKLPYGFWYNFKTMLVMHRKNLVSGVYFPKKKIILRIVLCIMNFKNVEITYKISKLMILD